MKSVITAVILAAVTATSAIAGANTTLSPELVTLAMTGNPDAYAAKFGGTSNHKTGGTPGDFSYDVSETQLDLAKSALKANEFLAPHFAMNDGDVIVMVAPHLIIDGSVVKGIGPNDNFIVVRANGNVQRRDVSQERDFINSTGDFKESAEDKRASKEAKNARALAAVAATLEARYNGYTRFSNAMVTMTSSTMGTGSVIIDDNKVVTIQVIYDPASQRFWTPTTSVKYLN